VDHRGRASSVGGKTRVDFWIRTIPSVLEEDEETGWKVYLLFRASSRLLNSLSCHVGVISEGKIPHPLHQHPEEELILVSSGEVDNIMVEGDLPRIERTDRLRKGALIYLPSHQPHTIRAIGPGPATLLVFKWEGHSREKKDGLFNRVIVDPSERLERSNSSFKNGYRITTLFETPTNYLQKLTVRIAELEPGAGFGWHRDRYDLAVALLSGSMDTMGVKLRDPAALFVTTGTPHWMRNPGQGVTSFLVVEFHRD
jgi:mannose-6-phosphate isomerase-like protein (cupin superfamily)